MIFKGFPSFPLELWITLWATGAQSPETLAARGFRKECPLSQQTSAPNEINHLAQLGENTMLRRNTRTAPSEQAPFWG
jgi:hypothetical protein